MLLLCALSALGAPAEVFNVEFTVQLSSSSVGTFVMEVHPEWAPLAAARFGEMLDSGFFKGVRFFRVVSGFMAQFGIHGNPAVAAQWRERKMADDPVVESNTRGTVSFATSGPDSRTTQMFINFADNSRLDGMGFSPFARVVAGMETVDAINAEHGETPDQGRIQAEGHKYLRSAFPRLSFIRDAVRVPAGVPSEAGVAPHQVEL